MNFKIKSSMLLWVACLFLALQGCSDKTEAPDLAAKIVGSYTITLLQVGTQPAITLPQTGVTAGFTFSKLSTTSVNGQMTTNIQGRTSVFPFGTVTLTDAGGGVVNLIDNGVNIGTASSNSLNISGVADDGTRLVIRGSK